MGPICKYTYVHTCETITNIKKMMISVMPVILWSGVRAGTVWTACLWYIVFVATAGVARIATGCWDG